MAREILSHKVSLNCVTLMSFSVHSITFHRNRGPLLVPPSPLGPPVPIGVAAACPRRLVASGRRSPSSEVTVLRGRNLRLPSSEWVRRLSHIFTLHYIILLLCYEPIIRIKLVSPQYSIVQFFLFSEKPYRLRSVCLSGFLFLPPLPKHFSDMCICATVIDVLSSGCLLW